MADNDQIINQGSNETKENEQAAAATKPKDPVRKWTFVLLALAFFLVCWYLVSDRLTPYTSQARIHALVVPVAPEVSGTILTVDVNNNQLVKAGQKLFGIDPERYQLAVQAAEADLQSARQAMGASTANVEAAKAALVSAMASLERAELNPLKPHWPPPGARSTRQKPTSTRPKKIWARKVSVIPAYCRPNQHWPAPG